MDELNRLCPYFHLGIRSPQNPRRRLLDHDHILHIMLGTPPSATPPRRPPVRLSRVAVRRSACIAGCALVVALWAWVAGSDPSTVAARAVATLIVAALAARLRAAPPTASVEACFYAVHESPQGAECASPMVYRRAARLAADARAASGPRGVQRGLLISPRRGPSESEDHADQYADSPERATTATTRDGLTLL